MNKSQNPAPTDSGLRNTVQQPFAEHPSVIEKTAPVLKDPALTDIQNGPAKNANDLPPMEAHRPHVSLKKKWTEYISEFFMLFFAVFLGFLVENFRENKVEEERVERLMHTMVENIKYDTARLQINLTRNLELGKGLDSFRFQINEAIRGSADANKLYYYYWKYGQDFNIVVMNDAAISQLKSAGMLRMVRNNALAAEMGDYYERKRSALLYAREGVQKRLDALGDTYKLFFSFQGFDDILQHDTFFSSGDTFFKRKYDDILAAIPPLKLINATPVAFERLYNDVAAFELALSNYNSYIRFTKQGADSLMKHISEEYGIAQ